MYIYSKISKNDKLWGSSYGLGLKRGLAGVPRELDRREKNQVERRSRMPSGGMNTEKAAARSKTKRKKNKKLRGCLRMSKKSSKFAAENELSCPCGKEILDL